MRPTEPRLIDPSQAHQRVAREQYGVKNPRSIDEDAQATRDLERLPASDRPRITGSHQSGEATRELLASLERLGLVTDETDIDPELARQPYVRNSGPIYYGAKPTIAAGAAAGTGPTLSISEGTDHAGRITLVVGTTPGTGLLATITFNKPLPTASYVIGLFPADSDASTAAGRSVFSDFGSQTTTTWELRCSTVLVAGTSYHWWYLITEFDET